MTAPREAAADFAIRAVTGDDEPSIEQLLSGLDAESRHRRWFSYAVDIRRASHWAAHPEVDHALGLVAVTVGEGSEAGSGDGPGPWSAGGSGQRAGEIIGHAVMIPLAGDRAEVAFEVAAAWRRHGVAGQLLEGLVDGAAAAGVRELCAEVLDGNADMLAVLREHGRHAELRSGGVTSVSVPLVAATTVTATAT